MEMAAVTKKLDAAVGEITALEAEMEEIDKLINKLEASLKDLTDQEQDLILETVAVKPRAVFWKLPYALQEIQIEIALPCPWCNMFLVDTCVVPFSCGCLFHPHCMWNMVLVGGSRCPRCLKTASPRWMAQWRFPMSVEQSHVVTQTIEDMESLGWMEPSDYAARHWGLKKRDCKPESDVESPGVKIQKTALASTSNDQKASSSKSVCEVDLDTEPMQVREEISLEAQELMNPSKEVVQPVGHLSDSGVTALNLEAPLLDVGNTTLKAGPPKDDTLQETSVQEPSSSKVPTQPDSKVQELSVQEPLDSKVPEQPDSKVQDSKVQEPSDLKVAEPPIEGVLPIVSVSGDAQVVDQNDGLSKEDKAELENVLTDLFTIGDHFA